MKLTHLVPKALKQFLIKKEMYNQCLINLQTGITITPREEKYSDKEYTLDDLFVWDESPEGHSCWCKLHEEYMRNIYDTDSCDI